MDASYFLGIDAGGSQCRARLEDQAGALLGEGRAGPANFRLGAATVAQRIIEAAQGALAHAGLADGVLARTAAGLGIAGIERQGARSRLAAQRLPFCDMTVATDAEIAHWGAHQGADGGTLIVGTGSAGLVTVAGRTWRLGGYGFPVSDQASGAQLGLEAMRLALLAHDGLAPMGGLARTVLDRFGGDIAVMIGWQDRASATDYAALAPLVADHVQAGDAGAQAIMAQAAGQLGAMIGAMRRRGAGRVVLLGGLAAAFTPWLAADWGACLVQPQADALAGALMLARGAAVQTPAVER